LHFGLTPPVGIVRVEQYLAEYLVKKLSVQVKFVAFDATIGGYRLLRTDEQELLDEVLFRRYSSRELVTESTSELDVTCTASSVGARARQIFRKFRTASRIPRQVFDEIARGRVDRLLPVGSHQSRARRLFMRMLRGGVLLTAGCSHAALLGVLALTRGHQARGGGRQEGTSYAFAPGDILVLAANAWDYMNYDYLAGLVRGNGVRLVSVIHDTIAMEMPFVTPDALDIYHRHWVEIGHLAHHLVAVSEHSMRSYRRLIAEPNALDPRMSFAHLPNFLKERRREIGEVPIEELLDRRFVVFCSTIETRKNHLLLLHLWDRLRDEIDKEDLPILVFVGRWGWGIETVRLFSDRNWQLRGHLQIREGVSDAELIWLYRNARFTVFPSLAEGFGLAAAESLSFGTPVVVSNYPALIEASEGLMPAYDPLDFAGWLAEMRRLILDDLYLAALRKRAARYKGAGYDDFARAIWQACLDTVQGGTLTPHREEKFGA
jgi:glycosyltransferase involved in cell wall biosynthesis